MALEKNVVVDNIEIIENDRVQVRTKTTIFDDGKQISEIFHRHIVAPGDDYSAEDSRVQAVCAAIHTADVVAAYAAEQAKNALPEVEAEAEA
jgi:hypothetical protein